MKKQLKLLFLIFFVLATSYFSSIRASTIFAETEEERMSRLAQEIEQYEQEIEKLQSQANTLSNQIAQYNAQIRLTSLRIAETEEKVNQLRGRISLLEISLNTLNEAFSNRAVQTYKMARLGEPFFLLITAADLSDIVSSFHYLRKIQEADRDLMVRLDNARVDYEEEKYEKEELQTELETQKSALDTQKAAKGRLLADTKNDEIRYQQLLSAARAEFEAIQAIIAGRGDETEIGPVSEGEKIASVIQGVSCNSSGEHLHFMVIEGSSIHSPFSYLKGGIDYEDCSGSSCGSGDGDAFNPSGPWNWPISPKIKFTQGYGSTWAITNTWIGRVYSFHNGIDINNKSAPSVNAVKSGTLYRGSYTGYNGCNLRYVRVDHGDSNLDTLYLHINY